MTNLRMAALVAAASLTLAACSGRSTSMVVPQGPAAQSHAQGTSYGTHSTRPADVAVAPSGWSATATQGLALTNATDLGTLAASQPITVRVGLQLQNVDQLKSLVASGGQLDPGSFTASYGPTAAQISAVTSYLSSQGFSNISVEPNNVLISADGTAGQAAQAFNTSLHSFSQNGATVYANVTPAYVPTSLSGNVIAVLGLNNIPGMQSRRPTPCKIQLEGVAVPTPPQACLRWYDPSTFQIAYDAGSTPTGHETSVAIMTWAGLANSLHDYPVNASKFGIPTTPVKVVQVGLPSPDTSADDEWTLDMTYSSGIANGLHTLYLYNTTSPTDSDIALMYSRWVTQHVAQIGNSSFGECEVYPYLDGSMVVIDEVFLQGAAQGQTMFVSTGDTGAFCPVAGVGVNGVPLGGAVMVNYPASSQYVVAVGGTDIFSNADGTYKGESGWEAGGGGVSQFEYSPYWQQHVQPVDQAIIARGIPDVAMDAALETGALLWLGSDEFITGGTSLASPLSAGTYARMQTAHGNHLGFAPPLFYKNYAEHSAGAIAAGPPPTEPWGGFHDILAGSNVGFTAAPGYDYVTGLGSFDIAVMNGEIGK